MMRWATLLPVVLAALSGCATIDDYHYSWVNHRRAALAWKHSSEHGHHNASSHYASGWKQGYFDVCTGRSGEPPVVPPSKYWSPHYQGERGHAAIEDWYVGYQDGATMAQSTGVGEWHPIYTGPTIPVAAPHWPLWESTPPAAPLPSPAIEVEPAPPKVSSFAPVPPYDPAPVPMAIPLPVPPPQPMNVPLPAELVSAPLVSPSQPPLQVPSQIVVAPPVDSWQSPPPVIDMHQNEQPLPVLPPANEASAPAATAAPAPPEEEYPVPPVFTDESDD